MIVRCITVKVKSDQMEAFKAATVENRRGSIQEPGILRFDVLQSSEHPEEFFLYEVYASEDATAAHKETDHYRVWKGKVESMMAAPRVGKAFSVISPEDKDEW